jgi:tetratricopeptide (TPR) repeat protein
MRRIYFLIPLLFLLLILIWAVPAMIKAMPDRYVMRLPEPLQKLGLPDNQVDLLPTAERPVEVQNLLLPEDEAEIMAAVITPTLADQTQETSIPPGKSANDTIEKTPEPEPVAAPATPSPEPTSTAWPLAAASRLDGFQHKFQSWNNCGPATLAMALTFFDLNTSQEVPAAVLKPDPEDRNVTPDEMVAYVNKHTPYRALTRVDGNRELLRRFVANGLPVIVEIGIEPQGEYRWMGWYGHYLLMVAYDDEQEQFWVYDSWFGTSEEPLTNAHPDGRVLSYAELDTYWPHFNRSYIVLFDPAQESLVETIIGAEIDDAIMWQNALQSVQKETAEDPDNPFYWFNLGSIYLALGENDKAETSFDQARSIGLPWRMLWYQFGPYEAYYKAGRYEDVLLLADVTLQDRPYFEESYYYKGLALAAMGDEEGARENLETANSFNPNFSPAVEALDSLQ